MCGLWGYSGEAPPSKAIIIDIIERATRRGPDGWGYWTPAGVERGLGRTPRHVALTAAGETLIIGHCRLATVLGTKTAEQGQPIITGDTVLTHNGSVWNYDELRDRAGLETGNDSEALSFALDLHGCLSLWGLDMVRKRVNLGERFAFAAHRKGTVMLAAQGQTLYHRLLNGGHYWSSVQIDPAFERVTGMTWRTKPTSKTPSRNPSTTLQSNG